MILETSSVSDVSHVKKHPRDEYVLSNEDTVVCSRKQRDALFDGVLPHDCPITSPTLYPLRHAAPWIDLSIILEIGVLYVDVLQGEKYTA